MKTLRTINTYPPGSLMNPTFRYRGSADTDVAKTFARIRRELASAKTAGDIPQLALPMPAGHIATTTD